MVLYRMSSCNGCPGDDSQPWTMIDDNSWLEKLRTCFPPLLWCNIVSTSDITGGNEYGYMKLKNIACHCHVSWKIPRLNEGEGNKSQQPTVSFFVGPHVAPDIEISLVPHHLRNDAAAILPHQIAWILLLITDPFLGCHIDEAVKLVHPDRWWSTQNPHGIQKIVCRVFFMNVLSLQNRLRRLRLEVAGVFGNVKIWVPSFWDFLSVKIRSKWCKKKNSDWSSFNFVPLMRVILDQQAASKTQWFITHQQHPKLNHPQLIAPKQPIYHASTMDFPIFLETFWDPGHMRFSGQDM